MQNLYLNIVETISASKQRFIDLGLTPIRTIDICNGQTDAPEHYEFLSPALFVDYSIDWERGGSSQKRGIITLDVHILTDPRPGTEDWSSGKEDGIARLLYYSLIGELLESIRSDGMSPLYLIGEKPNKTDYFDYHILTFDASIVRCKGQLMSVKNVKTHINAQSDKV